MMVTPGQTRRFIFLIFFLLLAWPCVPCLVVVVVVIVVVGVGVGPEEGGQGDGGCQEVEEGEG